MNRDNVPIVAALFVFVGYVVSLVLVFELRGCIPDQPTTAPTPTSGACPLDATSYAAPVWMPECVRCQRITDRITGRRWWVLTMSDGSHVVLPLDEMEVH